MDICDTQPRSAKQRTAADQQISPYTLWPRPLFQPTSVVSGFKHVGAPLDSIGSCAHRPAPYLVADRCCRCLIVDQEWGCLLKPH